MPGLTVQVFQGHNNIQVSTQDLPKLVDKVGVVGWVNGHMVPGFIPGGRCKLRGALHPHGSAAGEAGGHRYLILESEMSNSRCMRCRSVPWFSFRLVVTAAKNGFLASKGLGGEKRSSMIGWGSDLNLSVPRGPSGYGEDGTRIGWRPHWASKKPHKLCQGLSQPHPAINQPR